LVGMFFHPFSHDCKLGGFVILKPLLADQSKRVSLGLPPFTGHHEYATPGNRQTQTPPAYCQMEKRDSAYFSTSVKLI